MMFLNYQKQELKLLNKIQRITILLYNKRFKVKSNSYNPNNKAKMEIEMEIQIIQINLQIPKINKSIKIKI